MSYAPEFLAQDPLKSAKQSLETSHPDHVAAQSFALIAIAEQLRIANLIALYANGEYTKGGPNIASHGRLLKMIINDLGVRHLNEVDV